jgi:hypothetical protein
VNDRARSDPRVRLHQLTGLPVPTDWQQLRQQIGRGKSPWREFAPWMTDVLSNALGTSWISDYEERTAKPCLKIALSPVLVPILSDLSNSQPPSSCSPLVLACHRCFAISSGTQENCPKRYFRAPLLDLHFGLGVESPWRHPEKRKGESPILCSMALTTFR